jgi:hypothetical protein
MDHRHHFEPCPETSALVCRRCGLRWADFNPEPKRYSASPETLLEVLRQVEDEKELIASVWIEMDGRFDPEKE